MFLKEPIIILWVLIMCSHICTKFLSKHSIQALQLLQHIARLLLSLLIIITIIISISDLAHERKV